MPISRIKTDGIQDDAITSAKFGDTNVATADIANSSVTSAKIADSSVTTAKIASGAVTSAKLDTNIAITGDLTVDTDTLKVDSTNNRVGINTTTMAESLTINNGNIRLKGSNSDARIQFFNSDAAYSLGSSGGAAIRFHSPSTGHQGIDFETHDTGVHHTAPMKITPEGYVIKQRHPMCSAGAGTTSTSATQEVTNMGVIVNNGNHYNTSNGRFTCPVAGTYEVNVHMLSGYAAAYNWVAIFKNGATVQNMHWNPDSASGHHYVALSCLQTCAANDTLSGGIQNVNGAATATAANFFLTVKLIG